MKLYDYHIQFTINYSHKIFLSHLINKQNKHDVTIGDINCWRQILQKFQWNATKKHTFPEQLISCRGSAAGLQTVGMSPYPISQETFMQLTWRRNPKGKYDHTGSTCTKPSSTHPDCTFDEREKHWPKNNLIWYTERNPLQTRKRAKPVLPVVILSRRLSSATTLF